jgi:hypothetical protein
LLLRSCYEFSPLDAVLTDGLILPQDLALRKMDVEGLQKRERENSKKNKRG